jgi:hypothetical protein
MNRLALIASVMLFLFLPSCTDDTELTSWQQVGSAVPNDSDSFYPVGFFDLALTGNNRPIIAAAIQGSDNFVQGFDVYQWNDTSWQLLGGDGSFDGFEFGSLKLDSNDNPVAGFCVNADGTLQYFYQGSWDGTEWQFLRIGGPFGWTCLRAPSLALNTANEAFVAYQRQSIENLNGRLSEFVVGFLKDGNLQEIGQPLNTYEEDKFVVASFLALDNQENPIVAYSEANDNYNSTISAYPSDIYVKHWNGADWVQLGDMLDENPVDYAQNPVMAVDANNNFFVAWNEVDDLGSSNVYVKRWNGSTWQLLGGALDTALYNDARYPSLALDSQGNPIVAFAEKQENTVFVYLRQWNGNSWQTLGEPLNSAREFFQTAQLALGKDDTPFITFIKASSDDKPELYVLRYTPLVQN